MDSEDRTVKISNFGNSQDRMLSETFISVRGVSIATLRADYPILEDTSFVKVDVEGYERVLISALASFFLEKKPVVFVSLHPKFIGHEAVQNVVDALKGIFPYLYEADLKTPFDTSRKSYEYNEHAGADIIGTWTVL
eukprot:gnl/MRDRNA2_/MRDRNA2_19040_c0_seq2.p2 gnl/MRDRNA2_/MRDRNA2_19040_c0~~gnl/MRDRNA2_/MRDRNA2_19040_c0_seq2.p2  ORF type:complete len:148 (+),score=27.87 gnl/MRDRNA2_/MRDRNA2_19040_c0_seq2:36-446(+)